MAMQRFISLFMSMIMIQFIVSQDTCERSKVIKIAKIPYFIKQLSIIKSPPPELIIANNNKIFYNKIKNEIKQTKEFSYTLKNLKKEEKLKVNIPMKNRKSYLYPDGDTLYIEQGRLCWKIQTFDETLVYLKDTRFINLAIDVEVNLMFILDKNSEVYVFNKPHVVKFNREIFKLEKVQELPHIVTAIATDRTTNNIIMSVVAEFGEQTEESLDTEKDWRFLILEKISESPQIPPTITDFNHEALHATILKASADIVNNYKAIESNKDYTFNYKIVDEVTGCTEAHGKCAKEFNMILSRKIELDTNLHKLNSTLTSIAIGRDIPGLIKKDYKEIAKMLNIIQNIIEYISRQKLEDDKEKITKDC